MKLYTEGWKYFLKFSIVKLNHLLKTQHEHFSFGLSNEALNVSSIKTLKLDQINHKKMQEP